jgi:Ni/Fe-hydrogenase 1 B-type cytochrome subunit
MKAASTSPVPIFYEPTGEKTLTRVYVWDLVVRITHWAIAFSILVLSVTGYYIGNPFIIVNGEAGEHHVMSTMRLVHFVSAIVFSLAVAARMAWLFLAKNKYARWNQLVPFQAPRRRGLWGTFLFYTFIKRDPPPAVGHNALAGATYIAVFGLYLIAILTGLGMYAISADSYMSFFEFLVPLFGGTSLIRFFHHIVMWLLLGFMVHHVFSGILMSVTERNGVMDSIISGFKWIPRKDKDK